MLHYFCSVVMEFLTRVIKQEKKTGEKRLGKKETKLSFAVDNIVSVENARESTG